MIAEVIEKLGPVTDKAERWFPNRRVASVRKPRTGAGEWRSGGLVQLRRVRSEHSTRFQPASWNEGAMQKALSRIITF